MAKKSELKGEFELEELRHKHRMEEIEAEYDQKKKAEAQKFDHMMSMHRIKRADIGRSQMRKDFNYGNQSN